ncbi:MAG: hypothetical protein J5802_01950 [Butyrivibrio sp.]|nr:hypothetical protein [Butyrivibrio sp.]
MNADYSYEILTTYFSIEEKNGDSIQLNFISWNKQKPKYDLRRWRNGKPLKGISLTEDTLKAICEAMSRIPIEAEEKKENTRSNDEVVERPSVRRKILREKVLGIVSKPEYSESQLRIEDLIGEQAVVNYLLRNNISSLSDLAKGIIDGSIKFTSNKEIKVYEALIKFDENAPEEIRGEDRRLFIGINKAYYEWPISVITPFLDTKEAKKITGRLLSGGYEILGASVRSLD